MFIRKNISRMVELHKRLQGKIEVTNKAAMKSEADLSLVYTPGIAEIYRKIENLRRMAKQAIVFALTANSVPKIYSNVKEVIQSGAGVPETLKQRGGINDGNS